MEVGIIEQISAFGLLYLVGIGVMFYLSQKTGKPMAVPGDIYKAKAGRQVYIPTGGAFIFAILGFVILRMLAF